MKFTIKLGKPNRTILHLLKQNHGLTGPLTDWDGIVGSQLYYGQSYESVPAWKEFLEEGAGVFLPQMVNQGAAAVLFIPTTNSRYLIYVFGYGFLSINDGFTEWDFGIKVVLNSISASGIKSMDSHTIDHRAKNKRIQLAAQGNIGEFEIDILQDLVSQISGRSIDTSFATTLTGGESLTLIADMTGSSILKKSGEIMRRYGLNTYKAEFNWIDFISPVKDPVLIDSLDDTLKQKFDGLLQGTSVHEFVLSYPTIIDIDNLDYVCFRGFGSETEFDIIGIEEFLNEYRSSGNAQLNHAIDNLYIDLYDGHGKVFKSFSLYKTLTTEIELNNSYYILANGAWFKLDNNHYLAVSNFFDQLLTHPTEYRSGEQTAEINETDYLAQPVPPGAEVLDRQLYRTHGTANAIEYADIVNDQQDIIHVKDGGSSSKLSHLFNQGFVSSKLLLTDKDFRTKFRTTITDPNIKRLYLISRLDPSTTTIVFKILKKGPVFKIPFFSKIVLYDTYQKINAMGFKFRLEWVEYI